jgi:AAA domain
VVVIAMLVPKYWPGESGMETRRLIARDDLLTALDRAAEKKVTVVSAPAGSGKTSLLRAWADRPGQRHRLAVMQVQRDQQDAQQFWLALPSAVRRASGTPSGAEPPAATPEFNGRAMLDRVISELEGQRGRVVLVVDDLHELTSPEALGQLTRLLTNLPPNAAAVLATRRDLRLRLHQLRLAGDPWGRSALHRTRNTRAARRLRRHLVRGGHGAAAPADGRMGRGLWREVTTSGSAPADSSSSGSDSGGY